MRIQTAAAVSALLLFSPISYADHPLVGTYKGNYYEAISPDQRPPRQTATLQITSVENGKVAGQYTLEYFRCKGTYGIEGTYQDNKLQLKMTGQGARRGCGDQVISLEVKGNTLEGHTSAEPTSGGGSLQGFKLTRQ